MDMSQLVQLFCLFFTVSGLPYNTRSVYDKSHPELGNLFQGDIILADERNALLVKEYLWPNGVVPYVFHSNYTEDEKAKVKAGMKGIEDKTCVKFVPHTSEADYIEIRKAPELGCGTMVGRRPGQGLPVTVNYQAPECLQTTGIIQHELMRVLGLFHEQSQPDRDKYVTVLWDNISPGTRHTCVFRRKVCLTYIISPHIMLWRLIPPEIWRLENIKFSMDGNNLKYFMFKKKNE